MSLERFFAGYLWALRPAVLSGMLEAYDARLRDERLDLDAVAAALGRSASAAGPESVSLSVGVAVIPVVGTLVPRSYLFSCGSTYGALRDSVQAALDDPAVDAILLEFDSPGGSVAGLEDAAAFLRAADRQKPLYAHATGGMCSAAYWLASSCRSLSASPSADVGSIGVLAVHTDRSGADAAAGIRRTFLAAGSHKALGHDAAPLDEQAAKVILDRVEGCYQVFAGVVAKARGLDPARAEDWAAGKVFLAAEALSRGLIDVVGSRDEFLTRIATEVAMNKDELQAKFPDLARQLKEEGASEARAELEKKAAEAAASGDADVLALAGAVLGTQAGERLGAAMATAREIGVTVGQYAKILQASGLVPQAGATNEAEDWELATRERMLEAMGQAAAKPAAPAKPAGRDDNRKAMVAGIVAGMKQGG